MPVVSYKLIKKVSKFNRLTAHSLELKAVFKLEFYKASLTILESPVSEAELLLDHSFVTLRNYVGLDLFGRVNCHTN